MKRIINEKPNKPVMLTINQAAALVDGITPYRVRQMCIHGEIPCMKAGKKYLINRDKFLAYFEK